MTVSDSIHTLRAIRTFADTPLPENAVRAILNAGRRAQSSKNTQPWHFIAIQKRDTLKQLAECGDYAAHLAGAALGIAVLSPVADQARQQWVAFDLGQATAYMQLAAWEQGIGSCIAAIYQPEKAKAILGVPQDLNFDLAISFGYPASEQKQPRALARGGRRPFEDVVHWERW